MDPNKEKEILGQSGSKSLPSDFVVDLDDIDLSDITRRIIIGGVASENLPNRQHLEKKGKAIQEQYKQWIIKKITDHFKVEREWLYFDTQSPWLLPDEKKIFFRIINTFTGESFVVVGDINKAGVITAWRVGLDDK